MFLAEAISSRLFKALSGQGYQPEFFYPKIDYEQEVFPVLTSSLKMAFISEGNASRLEISGLSKEEDLVFSVTIRQLHVLALKQFGLSDKKIGLTLGITRQTVKNHKGHFYDHNAALLLFRHSPETREEFARKKEEEESNKGDEQNKITFTVLLAHQLGLLHPKSIAYIEKALGFPEAECLPPNLLKSYCHQNGPDLDFTFYYTEWLRFCELVGCDPQTD